MRNPLLVPDLRELIAAGETAVLRDFFDDHHPGHVAEMIDDLGPGEGDTVFGLLAPRLRAEVLSYFGSERQIRTVDAMNPSDAAALLHLMSHDERAGLVNRLDEERVDQILPHLAQAERDDIRRLAGYEPGTAGAVMTTDYAVLTPELNVHEALERLRHEAPDRETINYSYVIDAQRHLIGFVSLKRLVLTRRSAKIENIMKRDVIVARFDEDQESIVDKIGKYDLDAIPVVDAQDTLLGIITHDDALDILRRKQTKDILAFGGVSKDAEANDEPYWQSPVLESVRRRIGWLMMLFVAGTITQYVIHIFQWVEDTEILKNRIHLDTFIPLLIGTGGNAGSQTVGTIIRGLALREIQLKDSGRVLAREFLNGLVLGLLMGLVGFVFTWLLLRHGLPFASVIGLSVLGICIWANVIGALVPLLAKRLRIDPAMVSAPLISTLVDATGLCIFYLITIAVMIKIFG